MSNSNVETNINNFKKFSYFLKGPAIVTVRQAIGRAIRNPTLIPQKVSCEGCARISDSRKKALSNSPKNHMGSESSSIS